MYIQAHSFILLPSPTLTLNTGVGRALASKGVSGEGGGRWEVINGMRFLFAIAAWPNPPDEPMY